MQLSKLVLHHIDLEEQSEGKKVGKLKYEEKYENCIWRNTRMQMQEMKEGSKLEASSCAGGTCQHSTQSCENLSQLC